MSIRWLPEVLTSVLPPASTMFSRYLERIGSETALISARCRSMPVTSTPVSIWSFSTGVYSSTMMAVSGATNGVENCDCSVAARPLNAK